MSHLRRKRVPSVKKVTASMGPIATAVAAFLIVPSAAQAYLDAASGSMIIQAVITAVMGGLFIFRNQWRRLKSLFSSESAKEADDATDEPQA